MTTAFFNVVILIMITLRLVKYRLSHISTDREPFLQPEKFMIPYLQPPCDTSFTVKTRSRAESAYGGISERRGQVMKMVMTCLWKKKQTQELTTMRRKLSVFGLLESVLWSSSL